MNAVWESSRWHPSGVSAIYLPGITRLPGVLSRDPHTPDIGIMVALIALVVAAILGSSTT